MTDIATKTIGELKDLSFYVPSYQRGYRWTEDEVRALLDDINEFSAVNDSRYCIQPLIVKKRDDGKYEVVDGQQRLTTIFIFMKIAEQEIRSAKPPYILEFQTRGSSSDFLNKLSDDIDLDTNRNENIDYYHISNAYEVMNKWLDEQDDKSVSIQELNTKIRKSVFFIWYEIPDGDDPTTIFTKVNLGKIDLTNSELIKALLLSKDNFVDLSEDEILKKQIEMSISWDRIEQGLHDNSFWYFLNDSDEYGTRIDMLFKFHALSFDNTNLNPKAKYYSFLVFSNYLKNSSDFENAVKEIWDGIERLYSEFREWYSDLDKYHIIGYLIESGVKIDDIFKLTRNKRKSAVKQAIIEKTENTIGYHDKETISKISYDNSNDRKKIKKLLLLFNIATLVTKSEKQYRFPFDIYKNEIWDIEHIHATADDTDESDDTIGNLTLLDAETNRSYKNAPYKEKRAIILEREKKGLFVPLCTKNIFLKAYSNDLGDMEKWNEHDKENYVKSIVEILDIFFEGGAN